jgi:mannose-6-phosphate isomerase
MRPTIVPLDNPVQNYAWGSRTGIAELLGRPAPGGGPEAELWIGAHPKAPSVVALPAGPRTLDALVRSAPEAMLGPATARRWAGELPLLMKMIAAAEPLSIQCHPNRDQALAGFARENEQGVPLDSPRRNYRDPYPKPEVVAALTRFVGLKGFRPRGEIARGLGALNLPELVAPLASIEHPDGLRRLLSWLWSRPAEARVPLVERAVAAAARGRDEDAALDWMVRLQAKYPGDVGVLAPLLLNLVVLEPEDALFLPAGELHAYLEGTAVEVMSSSDNVLRGGLTPKHVDVAELLAVGVFEPSPPNVLRPVATSANERVYPTPAEEFELSLLRIAPDAPFLSSSERGPELLLGLQGSATIAAEGASWPLGKGRSVFVPAAVRSYRIEGDARISRARVPIPPPPPPA